MNYKYCPISFRTVDSVDYKKAMLLFYEQNNISRFKEIFINQFEFAVKTYFWTEKWKNNENLTHASYVHWLADPVKTGQAVHSGSFAPANGTSRQGGDRQMPIVSVVTCNPGYKNIIEYRMLTTKKSNYWKSNTYVVVSQKHKKRNDSANLKMYIFASFTIE